MSLFLQHELQSIESRFYEPRAEELVHRSLFAINQEHLGNEGATEVGYDVYTRKGSAKIQAAGGRIDGVKFVGEDRSRVVQPVFTIHSAIEWTRAQMMAMEQKRKLAQGGDYRFDTARIASARRYILEKESDIVFNGDANVGIKGLLQFTNAGEMTAENVAASGTGSTDGEKRRWANKTADQILQDLLTGKQTVEKDGLFTARTLVLDHANYNQLLQRVPNDGRTILQWLQDQGMYFERVVKTGALKSSKLPVNIAGAGVFLIIDNDPEVIDLALTVDMTLLPAMGNWLQEVKQLAFLNTAGVVFRHASAGYVGKGISL